MSSLSRSRAGDIAAATVIAAVGCGAAGAAEVYYQPIASLASAYNSNANLEPGGSQSAVGYFADAATNIGIATKRSETFLQPRLTYNYYPTLTNRNRLEAFLNLNSRYSWQRDRLTFAGFFDHRDDVNAEQPAADFNTVNPGVGSTTSTTGRTAIGVTRNYTILDPTYSHQLTPLSSIGVAAEYQRMDYSPSDAAAHIDFNYYVGRVFYAKTIDQRTDFNIGAYGSKYVAGGIDSHSNSGGLQASGGYNWSPVLRSDLTVQLQRTKLEESSPHTLNETSTPWAATFGTVYKQQTSSYRLSIGRTLYPSSAGGLYTTDQVRGQYDRDVSPRLSFMGALRFFHDKAITGDVTGNDPRNYGTATVKVQYMLTRRLFVAGNYTYTYQKYRSDPTSAEANTVAVSFGFRGIERQH